LLRTPTKALLFGGNPPDPSTGQCVGVSQMRNSLRSPIPCWFCEGSCKDPAEFSGAKKACGSGDSCAGECCNNDWKGACALTITPGNLKISVLNEPAPDTPLLVPARPADFAWDLGTVDVSATGGKGGRVRSGIDTSGVPQMQAVFNKVPRSPLMNLTGGLAATDAGCAQLRNAMPVQNSFAVAPTGVWDSRLQYQYTNTQACYGYGGPPYTGLAKQQFCAPMDSPPAAAAAAAARAVQDAAAVRTAPAPVVAPPWVDDGSRLVAAGCMAAAAGPKDRAASSFAISPGGGVWAMVVLAVLLAAVLPVVLCLAKSRGRPASAVAGALVAEAVCLPCLAKCCGLDSRDPEGGGLGGTLGGGSGASGGSQADGERKESNSDVARIEGESLTTTSVRKGKVVAI
jgi:hypothetical protein